VGTPASARGNTWSGCVTGGFAGDAGFAGTASLKGLAAGSSENPAGTPMSIGHSTSKRKGDITTHRMRRVFI
jgi:hypothetical protein